jgi:hypothetical protein
MFGGSISPQEREIPLLLTTKNFPIDNLPDPTFRVCDFNFKLTPGLQLSNEQWMIGLKSITIPTRVKNFDNSCTVLIYGSHVETVALSDACHLTPKSITDFLNSELSSKSSYAANIKFDVNGTMVTCTLINRPWTCSDFLE